LAIDAGVDFPYLLCQLAMEIPPDAPDAYQIGKKLRWFLGDLDSLYIILSRGDRYSKHEKVRSLLQFLQPDFANTKHEIFRWNDFRPAIDEVVSYWRSYRKN